MLHVWHAAFAAVTSFPHSCTIWQRSWCTCKHTKTSKSSLQDTTVCCANLTRLLVLKWSMQALFIRPNLEVHTLHTDGVHDAKTRETIRHNGKCHVAAASGVSYLRYPAHMCGPSSNGRTQTKPAICCDSMSTQTCTTGSALGPF